ncbi:MAG: Saccharopine dehydrogenase [Gemmatimonadetes bacterium]|nr:Saccharopine dehydrogenase [Gemmatimonadota bacterium]
MADFILYGANGYTGRLAAAHAVERGLKPILAGRNGAEVRALAAELGLPHRVFALDDPGAVDEGLAGAAVVLHCAGPFARTSRPMVDACLRGRVHYLDITGEIAVFEAAAGRGAAAEKAGVMLLPGAGFDVVPSDCLAAHLKQRLPTATRLRLAFRGAAGVSRGTATTTAENLGRGGAVRREGRITPVPAAWKSREVDFGAGPVTVTTIPWGDVSTAFHSTGIPDIEVYTQLPGAARRMLAATRHLGWLVGSGPVQKLIRGRIHAGPPGPTEEQRARGKMRLWGEVEDAHGRRATARMHTPEGYLLTALTSIAIVERVLAGDVHPGFCTPSLAYGADFILGIDGVTREDVD